MVKPQPAQEPERRPLGITEFVKVTKLTSKLDDLKKVLECLKPFLDSQGPIPRELLVEGVRVPFQDFGTEIKDFRRQYRFCSMHGEKWPCVEISQSPGVVEWFGDQVLLIPIDLFEDAAFRSSDAWTAAGRVAHFIDCALLSRKWNPGERVLDTLADAGFPILAGRNLVAHAASRAERAGFRIVRQDLPEARGSFFRGISQAVAARWRFFKQQTVQGSDLPPLCEVSVSTTVGDQNVLCSKGYFLSTRQGFGRSTPARRKLRLGCYCFGIETKDGEPDFSDILWEVNAHTEVHLNKP